MERLCMRPGCDRSVVARLTYDTISCQVWLDAVRDRPGPAQEICELHTARLTVPRGWMLCDRRDESPALFVPESPEPVAATVARSTGRQKAEAEEPQPELFGVAVAAEESPSTEPEPEQDAAPDPGPVERVDRPVERRVERRVAQTAPVAPAAPASAPIPPRSAPAAVVTEAPAAAARGGARNGNGTRNGRGEVDGHAPEHDDEDLPQSLQATSPLLSRAFRATGHQRSVLTHTLLNDSDEKN